MCVLELGGGSCLGAAKACKRRLKNARPGCQALPVPVATGQQNLAKGNFTDLVMMILRIFKIFFPLSFYSVLMADEELGAKVKSWIVDCMLARQNELFR